MFYHKRLKSQEARTVQQPQPPPPPPPLSFSPQKFHAGHGPRWTCKRVDAR